MSSARLATAARERLGRFWSWLRAVCGDSAYDEYLRHAIAHGKAPLTREEFYLDALQRRYSTVSRCC